MGYSLPLFELKKAIVAWERRFLIGSFFRQDEQDLLDKKGTPKCPREESALFFVLMINVNDLCLEMVKVWGEILTVFWLVETLET